MMESCLDTELWQACAGNMIQMPLVNSKVVYFPQGHAEHANGVVDFKDFPEIPEMVVCMVSGVKYMADLESDEVFVKMRLVPLRMSVTEIEDDGMVGNGGQDGQEKSASFSKTLTQSDANNGGGFSVPRYCAETIFPKLDYSQDPPVQNLHAKDVHGMVWKFRHIYRGTPRRHLLTTGWSNFVNHKKLVAGDSIVFVRSESGELFVGTRRAKRGIGGGEPQCGWTPAGGNCDSPYGGYSIFDNGRMGVQMSSGAPRMSGKVSVESVVEAARLAASGNAFDVVYYPRASTPEFCVKASAVNAAMRTQWCPEMKFKMAFETEDSSRVSWFMGTTVAVHAADPVRWPNSPWRILQVVWDEQDLLHNVKRVSPWLVELVSPMPNMHLAPFSPPMKRLRLGPPLELPLGGPHPGATYTRDEMFSNLSYYLVADNVPAGIQGARHGQFGQYPLDLHLNNYLQRHPVTAPRQHYASLQPTPHASSVFSRMGGNTSSLRNVECHPQMPQQNEEIKNKPAPFMLFGKPILTEDQMSPRSRSSSGVTAVANSSDGNTDKTANASDGSGQSVQNVQLDSSSEEGSPCCKSRPITEAIPQSCECSALENVRCRLCSLTLTI